MLPSRRASSSPSTPASADRQAEPAARRRNSRTGSRLVDRQREHLPAAGSLLAREAVEQRHLDDAGRAPGGPEVEQQRLAAQAGHRQLAAVGRLEARATTGRSPPSRVAGVARRHSATPSAAPPRPPRRRPRRPSDAGAPVHGAGLAATRSAARSPRSRAAARVGLERAAQVVVVEHGAGRSCTPLAELGLGTCTFSTSTILAARAVDAAARRSRRAGRSARSRPPSSRRRTGRCATPFSRVAVPRQTAPVRCGRNAAGAPSSARRCGAARRSSAGWVSAWNSVEVGAHLVFDLFVARQLGRAAVRAEVARRAPLGGAVLQAFLDDQPRRGGGDRLRCGVPAIGAILGSADARRRGRQGSSTRPMRATMVAARPTT